MAVQVPSLSAAASASFNKRFATLPDELKLMVIRPAVSTPGVIDIRHYFHARQALTGRFADDADLLAMAREEFDHVNTFRVRSNLWSNSRRLARRLRNLQVTFTLTCEGGGFYTDDDESQFRIPNTDLVVLFNIVQTCARLESLDVVIDNTGSVAAGLLYTSFGMPIPIDARTKAVERFRKAAYWLMAVRALPIAPWRQGLKVERKLTFLQSFEHQNVYRAYVEDPTTRAKSANSAQCHADMCAILDAPVAVCHFADGE